MGGKLIIFHPNQSNKNTIQSLVHVNFPLVDCITPIPLGVCLISTCLLKTEIKNSKLAYCPKKVKNNNTKTSLFSYLVKVKTSSTGSTLGVLPMVTSLSPLRVTYPRQSLGLL